MRFAYLDTGIKHLAILLAVVSVTACNPDLLAPDTTAPTLKQVTPVAVAGTDTTPSYTFSSTEAGTITYGGSCSSVTTKAVKGNNTITFNTLAVGSYSNCTIKVKDAKNNLSKALVVTPFEVAGEAIYDSESVSGYETNYDEAKWRTEPANGNWGSVTFQ